MSCKWQKESCFILLENSCTCSLKKNATFHSQHGLSCVVLVVSNATDKLEMCVELVRWLSEQRRFQLAWQPELDSPDAHRMGRGPGPSSCPLTLSVCLSLSVPLYVSLSLTLSLTFVCVSMHTHTFVRVCPYVSQRTNLSVGSSSLLLCFEVISLVVTLCVCCLTISLFSALHVTRIADGSYHTRGGYWGAKSISQC